MTKVSAPSAVEVQHQIRANASQLQDYFSDLYAWEKSIGKEDFVRKKAAKTPASFAGAQAVPPPRVTKGVKVGHARTERKAREADTLDAHTYDKGYKRWETFDVDAALKEADEADNVQRCNESLKAMQNLSRQVTATKKAAAALTSTKSRDELKKEDGNMHYKQGDYVAAIKSYTRCLGYNPQNVVVLSNRAMAYLKNREFANAEDDCTLALKTDPTHVKSYSRRGTARNSLGKHRLALLDFHCAATLDPNNRQSRTQLQSTRELIRMAIKRSPKRTEFDMNVTGEDPMPSPNQENEQRDVENVDPQQQITNNSSLLQESDLSSQSLIPEKKVANLPKLPKKAPTTSYEFNRVWKTLGLRGDEEQTSRLLRLRADYLRKIDPCTLSTVFQSGMESDVLGEIFHTLRNAALISIDGDRLPKDSIVFALALVNELTKVPRFNMTIMLLSSREKDDITWVIKRLAALVEKDTASLVQVAHFSELYEVP